jgi:hypothetical protein
MNSVKISALIIFALCYSLDTCADEVCSKPEKVNMTKTADLVVPNSPYALGICYLPEVAKKGVLADHQDLIVLKKYRMTIAKKQTTISISVGRIADLVLEKATDRFISVSYGAGEFCNGIVIFDVKKNRVAAEQGCLKFSDQCHVTELLDRECKATIECRDGGAEGEPPSRKAIIRKKFDLCDAG